MAEADDLTGPDCRTQGLLVNTGHSLSNARSSLSPSPLPTPSPHPQTVTPKLPRGWRGCLIDGVSCQANSGVLFKKLELAMSLDTSLLSKSRRSRLLSAVPHPQVFAPSAGVTLVLYAYLCLSTPPRRGIPFRERVTTYMVSSRIGFFIEVISALLSVFSCGIYIAGTYHTVPPAWYEDAEISMSDILPGVLAVQRDFSTQTHFLLCSHFSLRSMPITVVPVVITTLLGLCEMTFGVFAAARVLKFLRVIR